MDDNSMFILFALIVTFGLLGWKWLGLFYQERKSLRDSDRNGMGNSNGE